MALTEFLGVSDASSRPTLDGSLVQGVADNERHSLSEAREVRESAEKGFSLSAVVEGQMIQAENQTLLLGRLSRNRSSEEPSPGSLLLPGETVAHPVSHQFREAMYSALMTVMEERDEAHARMVAAGVLHVHVMEQQKKAVRRLSMELEALKAQRESVASEQGTMKSRVEKQMQQDSEAELISLCQQLAGEISARTSASLEIVRLKESRQVERENEAAERLALEDELKRTKELLASTTLQLEQARNESRTWQQSYENVLHFGGKNGDS